MTRHPNWGHPDHDACGTGFIARMGAAPAHDIVQHALTALERLTHRGGVDADGASGDGAGLLTSLPQQFFRDRALEQGVELPEVFGVGLAFLYAPFSLQARSAIHAAAESQELDILAWRRVPVDPRVLGSRARESMPEIWQFFVEAAKPGASALFDEYAAVVATGAAVSLQRAQRRNQYHRFQPALAARARRAGARAAGSGRLVRLARRGRERFGQLRQRI
jgi:glutamate synthase domain-containing protein 1